MKDVGMVGDDLVSDIRKYVLENLTEGSIDDNIKKLRQSKYKGFHHRNRESLHFWRDADHGRWEETWILSHLAKMMMVIWFICLVYPEMMVKP